MEKHSKSFKPELLGYVLVRNGPVVDDRFPIVVKEDSTQNFPANFEKFIPTVKQKTGEVDVVGANCALKKFKIPKRNNGYIDVPTKLFMEKFGLEEILGESDKDRIVISTNRKVVKELILDLGRMKRVVKLEAKSLRKRKAGQGHADSSDKSIVKEEPNDKGNAAAGSSAQNGADEETGTVQSKNAEKNDLVIILKCAKAKDVAPTPDAVQDFGQRFGKYLLIDSDYEKLNLTLHTIHKLVVKSTDFVGTIIYSSEVDAVSTENSKLMLMEAKTAPSDKKSRTDIEKCFRSSGNLKSYKEKETFMQGALGQVSRFIYGFHQGDKNTQKLLVSITSFEFGEANMPLTEEDSKNLESYLSLLRKDEFKISTNWKLVEASISKSGMSLNAYNYF